MAGRLGRTGTDATGHRPPPKVFLGIGISAFILNHAIVILSKELSPELLVMGSWFGLMGMWLGVGRESYEGAWNWARQFVRRELGLGLLTFAVAI